MEEQIRWTIMVVIGQWYVQLSYIALRTRIVRGMHLMRWTLCILMCDSLLSSPWTTSEFLALLCNIFTFLERMPEMSTAAKIVDYDDGALARNVHLHIFVISNCHFSLHIDQMWTAATWLDCWDRGGRHGGFRCGRCGRGGIGGFDSWPIQYFFIHDPSLPFIINLS